MEVIIMKKMVTTLFIVTLVMGLSTAAFASGPSGTGKTMVVPGDNVQVTNPDNMLPGEQSLNGTVNFPDSVFFPDGYFFPDSIFHPLADGVLGEENSGGDKPGCGVGGCIKK
jgi:hypothetical protein